MSPTAAPDAAAASDSRPSLAALAALGSEELTAELYRALPGDDAQRPNVAAFNSSL